ncbi:hypothetical protein ACGLWX_05890 [Halomonas sp. HMF6819]|uniref:hypothetical protein n=1 Tax=Halomonas sp. HMF6819 TaxID=3373085 RepID=UPI0037B1D69C
MPNAGGSYEIRNGERVLVHNTQPAPRQKPDEQAAAPAASETAARAPRTAKPAPTAPAVTQEVNDHE